MRKINKIKKEESNKISNSYSIAVLVVFIIFILRFGQLMILKSVNGQNLETLVQQLYTKKEVVTASRGNIYDVSGDVIATDKKTYSVYAVLDDRYKGVSAVIDKNNTAKILAKHIKLNENDILTLLNQVNLYQTSFGSAGTNLSFDEKTALENEHLPGIYFTEKITRDYPKGYFANNIIGLAQDTREDTSVETKENPLVNDLSCVGKVALTATLPIFNVLNIQTDVLPTVLLSTHSGGFGQNTRTVLQNDLIAITTHWQTFHFETDAILTGYFGNSLQLKTFLEHMPPHHFLAVDPVMADNGNLYSGFSIDYPSHMKQLCQKADIIFPNITEAFLLLNQPYKSELSPDDIFKLLSDLQQICQNVILTGVKQKDNTIGVAYVYNGKRGIIQNRYIPQHFFGTGDLLSALITALLIKGKTVEIAITIALQFIVDSLDTTVAMNTPIKYGVTFEPHLKDLLQHKGDKNDE